jgi:C_GCAxxG_C_C family probable redox protein
MEEKNIKKKAYSHFQSGYHCAEVISQTVLEKYSPESHREVVRAASGFGGGIGGSTRELCGAYTGGIMTLGYLLGRKSPGDSLVECAHLIQTFRDEFVSAFGSLDCPTLLKGFPEQEKGISCARLTAGATVMLTQIIEAFEQETEKSIEEYFSQPRDRVQFSCNPFTAGSCSPPDSVKSF